MLLVLLVLLARQSRFRDLRGPLQKQNIGWAFSYREKDGAIAVCMLNILSNMWRALGYR